MEPWTPIDFSINLWNIFKTGGLPAPVPSSTPPRGFTHGPNAKYKTTMCITFAQNGYCPKMAGCHFAHGPQELRNMGPNPAMGMTGPMYKTTMCKNVAESGFCSRGDGCHFAHSSSELRFKSPPGGYGASPMVGMKRKGDFGSGGGGGNFKTILCTNFTNFGECQYGGGCSFAHGPQELAKRFKI